MLDDATLLRRYADNRSEADFAEIVRRHLNLVYSAALRQVNGDMHLAEDVAQLVFTDVARKAAQLSRHPVLVGWLFTSTRFAAAKLVRSEQRRQLREQEAHRMQENMESETPFDWERLRSVLDEALEELGERDRVAILLRFFEGRDYAGIGARLALTDNAARMRVDRALDKLRGLLLRRGITSTSAALATALGAQAVIAAPAGLAATVTGAALAAPAIATATTLTFMSITKLQIGMAAAVLAVSSGLYVVQENSNADLREQLAGASQPADQLVALREENHKLTQDARQKRDLAVTDAELVQLREEAVRLQNKLQTTARPATGRSSHFPFPTVSMAQLDRRPKPVKLHPPQYPPVLAAAGVNGEVVVEFVISVTGEAIEGRVIRSSHRDFEAPALAAVQQWRFDPGMIGTQQVNTRVSQLLEFKTDKNAENPGPDTWF